ncbi:MAG TPA: SMP-30/gluconolactonase/LRE family protein [Vicinamibacterales bacterium]|nr:SMP-30/gluconolactonase/LRE family protein [Vicinamibacterales bacterium]
MRPDLVLDARLQLGEGPIWDADRGRLLFVDIMRGHVHEFDPVTGRDRVVEVGQPVGAVAPASRGDWVIAARDGFFRVDPATGATSLIAHIEKDDSVTRMNDGYVDARGRFWAGTMGMGGVPERGSLYRLDPDGSVTRHVTGVHISNGIDWSPDGRLMYYSDTGISRVDVFDFDESAGTISNRRTFVTITEDAGYPDGLVVDAEGFVWLALWEGGAVRRYAPDGTLDRTVAMPASLVTKCAFGGVDLSDLYITTAWIDLDEAGRAREPLAGGLFRLRPGVRGRAATRFAG